MEHTLLLMYLALGLLSGFLIGWLVLRLRLHRSHVSRTELQQDFVHRSLYEEQQRLADIRQDDLVDRQKDIENLRAAEAALKQEIHHLREKLGEWQQYEHQRREQIKQEMEILSQRILEEKGKKFSEMQREQLGHLLNPLQERIREFELKIKDKMLQEVRDNEAMRQQIEQLHKLNAQLSQDAQNLSSALKGDSKTQGDWGELQLERLLQSAGLEKGIHYRPQQTLRDENGKAKRPDFIIDLPEGKNLIIDSKVSLTAYERFVVSEDTDLEKQNLEAHLHSIKRHIKDLSSKNYPQLYDVNSPDYVLLFVPIESAFALAFKADPQLFAEALDQQVVLVSSSTLLATMRTVAFIWKQEKQKQNVLEIAEQSGRLYDKLVAFAEDLMEIGRRLKQAEKSYDAAMYKLTDGKRSGDTLIGKAERIKELGARSTKRLPPELIKDQLLAPTDQRD